MSLSAPGRTTGHPRCAQDRRGAWARGPGAAKTVHQILALNALTLVYANVALWRNPRQRRQPRTGRHGTSTASILSVMASVRSSRAPSFRSGRPCSAGAGRPVASSATTSSRSTAPSPR